MRNGILALASLALASCGSALAGPQSLEDTLKRAESTFNSRAPDLLGSEYPGTKASAHIEGSDTLVMRFDNAPVGDSTFDPYAVQKTLRKKVCDADMLRRVIDSGGRLKLQLVSHVGKTFPPVLFSRC